MSLSAQNANAYLRTRVMTASREELRLLLLEGALKFTRQARQALDTRDYETLFHGTDSARNIVLELITTIRPELNPSLAEQVRSLYTFLYVRLTEASFEKNQTKFDEVINLLEYERETWVLLMQKLASERAGEAPGAAAPSDHEAPRQPLSVQG